MKNKEKKRKLNPARLEVLAIPVPDESHPQPPHPSLPKHEFTMGLIAPKGCGKTTVICNLLNFYRGYFHKIFIFSPTVQSDEKWDWVKEQDLVAENVELKAWLRQIAEQQLEDAIVQKTADHQALEGIMNPRDDFSAKLGEESFFDDYDDQSFRKLMEDQRSTIGILKSHGRSKFLADRVLVIFDDLVGSALFSGTRGSYFKGINTRHRHFSASFIMVSQGYKEIPKTIRSNFTCMLVFEIGNEKEVESIYEEYAMGLKRIPWEEMYRYCVRDEYCFLYLNLFFDRGLRMMKNFTEVLTVTSGDEPIMDGSELGELG